MYITIAIAVTLLPILIWFRKVHRIRLHHIAIGPLESNSGLQSSSVIHIICGFNENLEPTKVMHTPNVLEIISCKTIRARVKKFLQEKNPFKNNRKFDCAAFAAHLVNISLECLLLGPYDKSLIPEIGQVVAIGKGLKYIHWAIMIHKSPDIYISKYGSGNGAVNFSNMEQMKEFYLGDCFPVLNI